MVFYMIDDYHGSIITEDIFNQVLEKDDYYKGRWTYFSEIVEQLHKFDDVKSVLEFGPYKLPFVKGSDIVDQFDKYVDEYPFEIGELIVHDCSQLPLPIEDNKYDVVIACQVLEHFGIFGEQKQFFDELERICSKAIISLPYLWFNPKRRDHHMIDKHVIRYWARGRKPTFEMITGRKVALRILQIYDFDNGSSIKDAEKFSFKGYVNDAAEKEMLIKKLEDENRKLKAENKKVKNEIDMLKSTKSWKMTEPIRKINNKLK